MKKTLLHFSCLASLILLTAALSGCALGGRRLNATQQPAQPPQSQPAATAAAAADTPATVENTLPAAAPTAASTSAPAASGVIQPTGKASDDLAGQKLIDQLNVLDAANQAGDKLDNLP
jgi:hypothetical protein